MEQQEPIVALHHVEAEVDEANGARAEIVGFPTALGNVAGPEKNPSDFAVARVLKSPIESAQAEDESVAASLRQRSGIGTGLAAGQAAPETDRGDRANLEELIERQENRGRFGASLVDLYAQRRVATLDNPVGVVCRARRAEG